MQMSSALCLSLTARNASAILARMRCWVGGEEAEGVCRFCGRGVCKQHARTRAFLFEAWEQGNHLRALAVEDALWCGVCKAQPQPINADFLRGGGEKR